LLYYLKGQNQDEDSEAEKLSPLLDAKANAEVLDTPTHRICDIDMDDELPNGENSNQVNMTCHSH
jgi:hypothetical protein